MTPEIVEGTDKAITVDCGVSLEDIEHGGAVCPAVFVESEYWGLEDSK